MTKEMNDRNSSFYVKSVEIQNLACFGWGERKLSVEFKSCPGWQSIVGSSGSGKTTLLRVIAATLMGPLVAHRGDDQLLANGAALGTAKVMGDEKCFSLEWRTSQDGVMISFSNPSSFFGPKTVPQKNDGHLLPVAGFGAARRLVGESMSIQEDLKEEPNLNKVLTLLRDDATLIRGQSWLRDLFYSKTIADTVEKRVVAEKQFESVMAMLRDALMPEGVSVVGFKILPDGVSSLLLNVDGAEIPLTRSPDAYRAMVGLVLELCRLITTADDFATTGDSKAITVTVPAIVLIDEPELHLGRSELQAFKRWLLAHFPNTQFIVATNVIDDDETPQVCLKKKSQ